MIPGVRVAYQAISRRAFGALVAGLCVLNPMRSLSASAERLDLDTDAGLLAAVLKMRASTDGSIRFGWLEASRSAYIDGKIIPLYDVLAGSVLRGKPTGPAAYSVDTLEVTYYLNQDTGELLDRLPMPLTGRVVDVPLYRSGPKAVPVARWHQMQEMTSGSAGVTDDSGGRANQSAFAPAGRVDLDRSAGPYRLDGKHCWIRTSEYGRVKPTDVTAPEQFYNEAAIWRGHLDELLDPTTTVVSATLSYAASTSWRPWMHMGDVRGHTMSNGFGRKVLRLDDMPARWLALTAKHHPDIIESPENALKPTVSG